MSTAPHREDLATAIARMPVVGTLGITVAHLAPGRSELHLGIRPELTFDGRTVQGGVVGVLADFAGVSAAAAALPEGWAATTVSFSVSNLAPARGARLVALGHARRSGRQLGSSTVEVYAEDGAGERRLVATATTTSVPVAPAAAPGERAPHAGG